MPAYRPDKFLTSFEKLDGAAAWKFLHQKDTLITLQTAVILRRPGVEAIAPALKAAFPNHARKLKFRQMIGHMIRQIMEAKGFTLKRANVRIGHRNALFQYGSVYQPA